MPSATSITSPNTIRATLIHQWTPRGWRISDAILSKVAQPVAGSRHGMQQRLFRITFYRAAEHVHVRAQPIRPGHAVTPVRAFEARPRDDMRTFSHQQLQQLACGSGECDLPPAAMDLHRSDVELQVADGEYVIRRSGLPAAGKRRAQ